MSCYVEFDRIRPGRKSIALCGDWCDEADISGEPDCPECQRLLLQTADDLFGTEGPGIPVVSKLSNPLVGYKERTRKSS